MSDMTNSSLSGILQDALGQDNCRQVLLVSRVGTVVAGAARDSQALSPSIGPIVASTFATGSELGRLLGAGEHSFHFQRGRRQDLVLCQMPSSGMILAAAFPVQVSEETALAFASEVIEQIETLTPTTHVYSDPPELTSDLRDEATALIDQLFAPAA